MRRHCARIAGILVLGAAAVLLPAAGASAHAELDSTSPRAGQVLDHSPASIDLRFSDAVDLPTAVVRVFDPNGALLADVPKPVYADPSHDVLRVNLPADPAKGTRTVVYRVLAGDGHPSQGQFSYSVGEASGAAMSGATLGGGTGVGLAYGIARWAAFVGLALAMGTTVVSALGRPTGPAAASLRRVFTAGWVTLVVAGTGGLLLYGPYVLGHGFTAVADPTALRVGVHTKVGRLLLGRLAALAALGVVAVAGRRARGRPPAPTTARPAYGRLGVALGVGGLLCLTWSLATHADHGGGTLLALPMDLLHLWAMSVWLGGLPALVVLVRSGDRAALSRCVPVFSRIAAGCVGLLVLTGVAEAWRQVGSPAALTTPYGKVLMTKLTLVIALVGLGGLARRRIPALLAKRSGADAERDFGRVVTTETVLGGLVLAVTAGLVGMQPASAAHHDAEAARLVAAQTDGVVVARDEEHTVGFRLVAAKPGTPATVWHTPDRPAGPDATTGWVTSEISPAAPGLPNELHLAVLDALGRPIALRAAAVELRLPDGSGSAHVFRLRPTEPGHLVIPFTLPRPGDFAVRIELLAAHGERTVVLIPLTGL
jgi:copper transport protein